ncbi:KTSC domain-containing protein [Sphingomonas nostoxanthinifaciens]|uniref:KTSC domain-containing protein n=1 Tax=Sphingomonas nostoxanthinifaciens TaxID=2872652 RepID=UPI001CC1D88C|nr:KTSC domain-containing protein [Sphingomonas nostoxanthinifaciens]UAK26230.1 KTSC domain-containing protein [Sphingomonas nostoxanthinifaciens]
MPSTAIRATAYDEDDRRLDVTFVTGRRYAYRDVPPEIFEELEKAPSKGRYFNEAIRDRFPFTRKR